MEIEISKDTLENLEKASKELGLNEKEIILRAIKLYLYSIREQLSLKQEIEAWERAGMQDMINLEEQI